MFLHHTSKFLITYFIYVILEIQKGSWKLLQTSKSLTDEIPEI